jgi:hypothetical protein
MSIAYDNSMPPRNPRRAASAPSLINRIQKPPLLDRLSRDDAQLKTPAAPFVIFLFTFFPLLIIGRQQPRSWTNPISTVARYGGVSPGTEKTQNRRRVG